MEALETCAWCVCISNIKPKILRMLHFKMRLIFLKRVD